MGSVLFGVYSDIQDGDAPRVLGLLLVEWGPENFVFLVVFWQAAELHLAAVFVDFEGKHFGVAIFFLEQTVDHRGALVFGVVAVHGETHAHDAVPVSITENFQIAL